MKVSDWRRKLAGTLVASGLLAPAAAAAANLDTNLILNPGFENVDLNTTGDYSGPMVLDWGGLLPGFAYSHNGSSSSGGVVPDYANGAPLAGGGNWYFTSNNSASQDGDIDTVEEALTQNIDVSTGASGGLIAGGGAAFNLGAFFNTFSTNNDRGVVQVDFFNGSSVNLGGTLISPVGNVQSWTQLSAGGPIPIGTTSVRVSMYGIAGSGGADGYIDNLDFQITEATGILLFLEVNTATGQTTLKNQTGDPVQVDYYEVTSAGNSLNPTAWNSLQEQNLPAFPAGNGSGNGWEQFGGSDAGIIGESFLTGTSAVNNSASINIGAAFQPGDPQDLVFRYAVAPESSIASDFDGDGDSDGDDFLVWQRGLGTSTGATKAQGNADGDADVDADDLAIWKSEFGGAGSSGPSVLVNGFVRYVTGAATAVPEPSSVILVGLGLLAIGSSKSRRAS
jgi:hypothetical protein